MEYYEKITTADTLSETLCVRGLPGRLRSKDAPSGIRKRKSANRAATNLARARHLLGMMPVLPHRRQESLEDRTYVPSRRISTASSRSSSTMRPPSIL